MKKQFLILLFPLLLASCGANADNSSSQLNTGIKGKFLNSVERYPYLIKSTVETEDSREFPDVDFMYCTTYPIKNITGWGVFESILWQWVWHDDIQASVYQRVPEAIRERRNSFTYRYDQALTVLKDLTYHYVYFIGFSPNSQDFVSDFMSIEVDIYGTYTYTKTSDNTYAINLSSPLSGTETITGGHYDASKLYWFAGEGAYKHSEPDKVIDFEELRKIGKEEIDWYTRSRVVTVEVSPEKASENKVYDDLFNRYFLDDFGPYCTYNE